MKRLNPSYLILLFSIFIFSCNKNNTEIEEEIIEAETTIDSNNTVVNDSNDTSPKHTLMSIKTIHGDLLIYLYDLTPLHKQNYIDRITQDFFDGELFNRVVKNFVLQGGCLDTSSIGTIVYPVDAEFDSTLKHIYGAVGGGRYGDDLNPDQKTSGCQFYIVDADDGTDFLDMKYTVFGQVIDGFETMDAISRVALEGLSDLPKDSIIMQVDTILLRENNIFNTYNFNDFR